jgi:hypothetical protein
MFLVTTTPAEQQAAAALMSLMGGFSTTLIMQGLKKLHTRIDNLPPHVKALVVVALSAGVTQLSALTGVHLPVDVSTWSGGTISTMITALLAMGIHSTKGLVPATSTDTTPAKS